MSGIADGVTSLVKGKRPEAAGSSVGLSIVFGVILAILALQIAVIARSARRLRADGWSSGRTGSFGCCSRSRSPWR